MLGEETNQFGVVRFKRSVRCLMWPTIFFVSWSTPEQEMEERKCNYERYRGLVQNDFANSEC